MKPGDITSRAMASSNIPHREKCHNGMMCLSRNISHKKVFYEGLNGVNRLATKGEKILLTTDKTRKKLLTSDN